MADTQTSGRNLESRGTLIITLSILPTVLSSVSVALRIFTRQTILGKIGSEDYAIVVAQILAAGCAITNTLQVKKGALGRHIDTAQPQELDTFSKTLYASIALYNAAQIVTKASFLLQYRRLFPSQVIQRICTYGLWFLIIWGISQQIYTAFSCNPLMFFIPSWKDHCIDTFVVLNINFVMNMVTDFIILAIPIWPVLQLQVNRKRKAHLLVVFCLGFIACAISVVRLTELQRTYGVADMTWELSTAAYLSTLELSIGILCACIPTLRPLVKKLAPRLVGSSDHPSSYGHTHQLSTIGTANKRRTHEQGSGIYIQKEVEFHSTTELRTPHTTKDPYSLRGTSSDGNSVEETPSPSTSKDKNGASKTKH